MSRWLFVALLVSCSHASVPVLGETRPPPVAQQPLETDSVQRDYSAELTRTNPTEPIDAIAAFEIDDAFRIELVAAEPLITDPVAICFDEFGRMFVVQMNGYSENPNDNRGAVRLLQDSDEDGRFDRATSFVDGLSWPTAIACYDGGVLLGVAPDIRYCADTDNDGVADQWKTVFTGFGRQNVQGLLNSFVWGIDNRLYGTGSSNGGTIKQLLSDFPDVALRRRDFAIEPDQFLLHAVAGGGQHGLSFDRWGARFVTSNSNHLQWVEFDERYLQRNRLMEPTPTTRSIAEDGPAAEVYRTSRVEPWRDIRTRLRVKGMVGGPVEGGGRAAGYFTGATGVTLYTGDAFPDHYREGSYAVVGDVGGNLVHLKLIEDEGLVKVARRVHDKSEFLTSTDNWFRPVQFANGPDGALYVVDMYREVIEHPASLPPPIKPHLDLNSGRNRGRIYRIVPREFQPRSRLLPGKASNEQLVTMLSHDNGWHRETAARLIVTRGTRDKAAKDELLDLLAASLDTVEPADGQIRARYCLASLDALHPDSLLSGLRHPDPQVRVHALRLAERRLSPQAIGQINRMVDDDELRVRYQLALTLGELPWTQREPALTTLAVQDAKHEKMRVAILTSIDGGRLALLRNLLRQHDHSADVTQMIEELARQLGRQKTQLSRAIALFRQQPQLAGDTLLSQLLTSTGLQRDQLQELLEKQDVADAGQLIHQVIAGAVKMSSDSETSISSRLVAIRRMQIARFEDVRNSLIDLLAPTQPTPIRRAALRTIGRYSEHDTHTFVLDVVRSLPSEDRDAALSMVLSTDAGARALLDRLEDHRLTASDISIQQRQRLSRNSDISISARAKDIFAADDDRSSVLSEYQTVLGMRGDIQHGQQEFKKNCSACHRLDGIGSNVGPDLQPLRNRGAAFMLTNILDPSREVDSRYEAFIISTNDGKTHNGIITGESNDRIDLKDANARANSIDRNDVETIVATGKSLMPDGLERELNPQAMADLIAYLILAR